MIAYRDPVTAYWWGLFMAHPLPGLWCVTIAAAAGIALVMLSGKKRR